uniref:polysaccharide biosynthesis protein n=1 Tax=Psychrobacillus sp. FSL H8-0483 TaxID=2921389 RepID=UPI00406D354E
MKLNYPLRYAIFLIFDSCLVLIAICISYWLMRASSNLVLDALVLVISYQIMSYFFQLDSRIWRAASIRELLAITYGVTFAVTLKSVIHFIIIGEVYFREHVITWLLLMILIGGSRFCLRLINDRTSFKHRGQLKRVLIVGAGEAGMMLIRNMKRKQSHEYDVVAIVDDNPYKQKLRVMDVKVYGTTKDISRIVQEKQIDVIILAIPSLGKLGIQDIYNRCVNLNVKIKTMPKIEDVMLGKVAVNDVRPIKIEDLLGREEVTLDLPTLSDKLSKKIILVTGAGGSIGSEICRQVAQFHPKQILLLGHGENSIYTIHMELSEKAEYGAIEFIPIIADVQDRERIFEIVEHYRPDVIYHAAAHKHVPLMEFNPREAVKNNIFGTMNVAHAASRYGVSNFVFISTDKAVNPTNVMGSTKRIAEMLIQNLARTSQTNLAAVRFGNVLGSRGSVIPRFRAQIAAGGPVTVTHPEMTRYFMTIPEASRLVLQAGVLARGGEVFVLDMGEPIKIVDIAKNLIRLSGFKEEEIAIEFTGIRPGEKMFEELLNAEEIQEEHVYPNIHVGKAYSPEENLLMAFLAEIQGLEIAELKRRVIEMANGKWQDG